ncbi:MAG TPA: hypothetical protein VNP03_07380 [Pseudonocardia sp.]|nr:hypothetical protein [Pseudonocardia sp.]
MDLALDQRDEPVGAWPGEHALQQVLRAEDLLGDQLAVGLGDLVLAAQEQAVDLEPQEPFRLARHEQHVQGDIVGDPPGEQTEDRHHQCVVGQRPHQHLHHADDRAEVDPRAHQELDLRGGDVLDQPVGQVLVAGQVRHHHVAHVDDGVQVTGHLIEQLPDDGG